MPSVQSETLRETSPVTEPGDHERMSHYAPTNAVTEAMILGTPVTALCGKTWVPTRDGTLFPLCPECEIRYAALPDS
jgi:hypothetical protein